MRTIRRGVFETNSSSTHSICVAKTDNYIEIPDRIEIDLGDDYDFGWNYNKYRSLNDKLAYLIFGIFANNFLSAMKNFDKLSESLTNIGVESFTVSGLEFHCYNNYRYMEAIGWSNVNHASELSEFVDAVLNDENLLKEYLFDENSFIITGNDNDETDINIYVNYDYEEFYKGN